MTTMLLMRPTKSSISLVCAEVQIVDRQDVRSAFERVAVDGARGVERADRLSKGLA